VEDDPGKAVTGGFFFSVLGFELRASCLLNRHSTT
jgi:hypothetical protein